MQFRYKADILLIRDVNMLWYKILSFLFHSTLESMHGNETKVFSLKGISHQMAITKNQ